MQIQFSQTGLIKRSILVGLIILLGFSMFLSLSGCANKEEKKPISSERVKKWQTLADNSIAINPVPAKKNSSDEFVLEDMAEAGETQTSESNKKIDLARKLPTMLVTMKMHEVSLPILLRTLARVADLDIMINESVQGQTKIVITDVPWDQAFEGVLDTFSLTYEWSGDILRVVSVEDLKKKQDLMEARQNYERTKTKHDLSLIQLVQKKNRLEPLVTKIVKIQYADLTSLQKNLTQYLHSQKKEIAAQADKTSIDQAQAKDEEINLQGSIMIDEFSNSLILHASRSDIKKIMPIIHRLDQPIKQVLIEAHIVEVESNTGKELGIQWGGLGTAETSSGKSVSIGGDMTESGQALTDDTGTDPAYSPIDGNIVSLPIAGTSGLALGVMAQKVGEYVLYAQLLALEEEGKLNIISKPSITTLDHRKAIIKSGKEVPFQTVISDDVNIEWKEAVIKLEVTPHIINDNIIRLEIVTHKDELDFNDDVNGNPTIITKNAQTTVMLLNGQTTVIGGLNKEKTSGGEDGVPGLKDIPALGWLFKSTRDSNEMEELLIFITPHILKEQTTNTPETKD